MRNRFRTRDLVLVFLVLGAFSCSVRSPTSRVNSDPRVSAGGDGAAAAARVRDESETRERTETAPQAIVPEQASTGPQVGHAVLFGHSEEARSLPAGGASLGEAGEINELNDEIERRIVVGSSFENRDATIRPGSPGRSGVQPMSQSALATLPSSTSFEGLADTDNGTGLVNPSDSNGAVGPNHYVEVVNNRVRVYDKSGNPLTAPFRQSSLFATVGGICSLINAGDPIVLYDKLADRWQISQFAFSALNVPPYHQCIAESINGDPAGRYYLYDFVFPSNNFPDYPKLSTWPDAYYMTTRDFFLGGAFNGEGAVALDRKKMLVGDPTATLIYFQNSNGGNGLSRSSSGMLPSDFDGVALPPPGAPNIFAIYTAAIFGDPQGDALRLFDFHVDFDTPANSTFTERPESPIAVAAFDPLNPNGRADIEQPPPSVAADRLDTIGDRLMYRLQYRNRDGVESLVSTHTVNVGLHFTDHFPSPAEHQAAPRYYELRRSIPGGAFSVYDQATFAPDAPVPPALPTGLNRWMGSAAIDNQGNLAVGYSTSSQAAGEYPSVAFAGRAYNETGGLLQGEAKIFQGLGSQQASANRWGDYSSLSLDPVDECTFFYVNEYYPTGLTPFNWHTRIGTFKFDSCTPPSRGKITGKIVDCVTGLPIVGAVVQVSDGRSGATDVNGNYSIPLPPGSYTVAASDPFRNCDSTASQNVSVSDGGTASANFCLTGDSKINLGAVTIDDSLGNDNDIVNRDECVKVNLGVSNDGCIADSNISGTLSTSTPGVTVNQALSSFPNLAVDTSGNNATPYAFTTSPSFVCGTVIQFTLTVTSDHQAPHDLHFSLPTCAGGPSVTVTGSLGPGDSLQDGRMGRDANPANCELQKGCPGVFAGSPGSSRFFDEYSFVNPAASPRCFTVALTPNCTETPAAANQIFSEAYLNDYIPTPGSQECTNYLGDIGASPLNGQTGSYSFNVPGGGTFVVVVNAVNSPTSTCSSYSATISGFPDDTADGGPCPACVLTPTVTTASLYPPSHNLSNVGLATTSTGVCPANRQVTVYSDEDDVDPQTIGDMSPDAKNIALGTLRLRAERRDTGDGRVYLIVVRTSDGTGNGAFSCTTVTVPNGSGGPPQAAVNAQAAAAKTFCTNNGGAAPAGYFLVGDGPVVGPKQ
jgi:hypothetical protein